MLSFQTSKPETIIKAHNQVRNVQGFLLPDCLLVSEEVKVDIGTSRGAIGKLLRMLNFPTQRGKSTVEDTGDGRDAFFSLTES